MKCHGGARLLRFHIYHIYLLILQMVLGTKRQAFVGFHASPYQAMFAVIVCLEIVTEFYVADVHQLFLVNSNDQMALLLFCFVTGVVMMYLHGFC